MWFHVFTAHLLSVYYSVCFRDGEYGLSKQEYRRFLIRLTKEQRKKFELIGSFEILADGKEQIYVDEFETILENMLKQVDLKLKKSNTILSRLMIGVNELIGSI